MIFEVDGRFPNKGDMVLLICPIATGRYARKEMLEIFSEEKKLEYWLKVEAALAKAHAMVGNIPKSAAEEIEKKANLRYVSIDRVKEIEKEIKHDLMALVKALTEACEGDAKKYVHLGATSNDIKDTALSMQVRDSLLLIRKGLVELKDTLLDLAEKYKNLVAVGRTHGQHANPITYGMKFAVYASEISRSIGRIDDAMKRVLVGKMTGATGTQAAFGSKGMKIQKIVMKELGLKEPLVTTQILQRDRYAEIMLVMAILSQSIYKIATEIRNLQRTEIGEVEEYFEEEKQVGSSAMPSKRNPITCERICGISKVIKYMAISELDNIPTWHERDLTNSSSERIVIPHVFILTDYMIHKMVDVLRRLRIREDNIKRNLFMTDGINMSESVVMRLVSKGIGRQDAHEVVRRCAMKALREGRDFVEVLIEDKVLSENLSEEEIRDALNPYNYIGTAVEQVERAVKELRKMS